MGNKTTVWLNLNQDTDHGRDFMNTEETSIP